METRYKILFVLKSSNPIYGGVARVCENLTQQLVFDGHDVFAISMDNDYDGLYKQTWNYKEYNVKSVENQKFLEKLYDKYKFDFVVLEEPHEPWIVHAVCALKGKTCIIGHFHNSPFGIYSYVNKIGRCKIQESIFFRKIIFRFRKWQYRKHYQIVSDLVDKMVLLSDSYKDEFLNLTNIKSEKLIGIPNPFPQYSYSRGIKSKTILYVGRVVDEQKRIGSIFRIWNKVYKILPEWRLQIVGGGNQLDYWKRQVEVLGLERISFEGFQNPEMYYKKASLFIMTSLYEGFPMTLVEAMQNGCIPIAFNSFRALIDIIDDGKNGIIVKAFDEDCFARALISLANDHARLYGMSENCIVKSNNFLASGIIKKWYLLFNELK